MQHAHDQGVLHRDIKPSNLMLDADGKLYVTDFGLARIEADAGMTMTGDIIGTLRYMAPEQALAKRVVVDHRADVYSLGATLYELLTLEPAFGETDRSDLLKQIAFEEPRPLRKVERRIPADLETIVLKAMAKHPDERYATAEAMADDLRRFSEQRPIHARRPKLLHYAHKFIRRHRAATTVAGVIALLVLMLSTAVVADRQRQIHEAIRFVNTSLEAALLALGADDVNQAVLRLSEAQTQIDASRLADHPRAREVAALRKEAERYATLVQLVREARRTRTGSDNEMVAPRNVLAMYGVMDQPNWLDALHETSLPDAHVSRVADGVYEVLLLQADNLVRWGSDMPVSTRQAQLERQCREAVQCLEKAVSFHAPSRGYYWLMANCALIVGNRENEQRLRTIALDTPPHDAAELFFISRDHRWGTVSHYRGYPKYTNEEWCKDCREMLRLDPTYQNGLVEMAMSFSAAGRNAEALIAWYGCVAQCANDNTGNANRAKTRLSTLVSNRASSHLILGQYDEAVADYETALAIDNDNACPLNAFAWLLATTPAEHVRDGTRAVKLATTACESTEYKAVDSIDTLAAACAESGDFEAAVRWSTMALELATDDKVREEIAMRLENFRSGKPWRQAPH